MRPHAAHSLPAHIGVAGPAGWLSHPQQRPPPGRVHAARSRRSQECGLPGPGDKVDTSPGHLPGPPGSAPAAALGVGPAPRPPRTPRPQKETYFWALAGPGRAERNHKAILISVQLGATRQPRPPPPCATPGPDRGPWAAEELQCQPPGEASAPSPPSSSAHPANAAALSLVAPLDPRLCPKAAFSPRHSVPLFPTGNTGAQRGRAGAHRHCGRI